MEKINFQDGTKVSSAKVTINGTDYTITPAVFSGATPFSSYIMNLMQTNIENAINKNKGNIGGEDYDNTKTYAVGDIVLYQDVLYICTTAVTTAGDFDSTKWATINVLEMIENKQSLPSGGTTGQVLAKSSNTDYDVGWVNQSGGGGSGAEEVFIQASQPSATTAKLWIDTDELLPEESVIVNNLNGSETTKAPSVNAVKNNCVLNNNIVTIYGQIEATSNGSSSLKGSIDINYPSGFNANNTIILAIGLHDTTSSNYVFNFGTETTADYSSAYSRAAFGKSVTLTENNMSLKVYYNLGASSSVTKTYNFKIVLMKTFSNISDYELGDVNMDGEVNQSDLTLLQNFIQGTGTLTDKQFKLADMNNDGVLNTGDTFLLSQKINGNS